MNSMGSLGNTQVYHPLSGTEIRLIDLESGYDDDPIRCQLHHFNIDDNPVYCALSYVWGDRNQTKNIEVNGKSFPVTVNLYDALWRFRQVQMEEFAWRRNLFTAKRYTNRPTGFWKWNQEALDRRKSGPPIYPLEANFSGYMYSQLLWVDAICIDQQNIDEKNRQIPRMRDIYSLASTTVAWLGNVTSFKEKTHIDRMVDASEELNILCTLLGVKDLSHLILHRHGQAYAETAYFFFQTILFRPWFTRVWIVQEVVLSTGTILMIGDRLTSLESLYLLSRALASEENAWALPPMIRVNIGYGVLTSLVSLAFEFGSRASRSKESIRPTLDSFATNLYSVLNLAHLNKHATDQHDMIYGVLGMTRLPELPRYLLPDYETRYEIVFWRYSRFLIERTGDLRCLSWKREMLPNVPTWVPDLKFVIPNFKVSRSTVFFSPDGRCMTVEGSQIGSCVKTYYRKRHEDPKGFYKVMQEFRYEILRPWSQLKKLPLDQVITQWLSRLVNIHMEFTFNLQSLTTYYKLLSHPHNRMLLYLVSRYLQSEEEVSYLKAIGETLVNEICDKSFFVTEDGIVGYVRSSKTLRVCNGDVLCSLKGLKDLCILQPVAGLFMFIRNCHILNQEYRDLKYEDWCTNRTTAYLTLI
ncbi:heterokaryon incompatibility protein-domain-containing protein [Hypoxylon sp. FL1857]|nr:heterokaryon incompatibility protein-domain-containing protein [Hypoxylon sp. FL1857]